MKITFFSNYMNHHQLPFSLALDNTEIVDYKFIATTPINSSRQKLGYTDMNKQYPFILTTYDNTENKKIAMALALNSDAVISGSAPSKYTHERIKQNKLTFRYSERPFKSKQYKVLPPRILASYLKHFTRFFMKPYYLLCASAYTAADYAKSGAFLHKAYKWGYFTEVKKYDDINNVIKEKGKNSILWVARFIKLKHPELMIMLAESLVKAGLSFKIRMIGTGPLENEIKQQIKDKNLENYIEVLGSMPPEKVREHMEKSEIFLFTSDFNEGWGAVLNESMNSGCAVVASHAIGSVPFLIKDRKNGMIYENGNFNDLFSKVKFLLENHNEMTDIGINAYKTMTDTWNADVAAERFIKLCEEIKVRGKCDLFEDGPCSRAEILSNNWYNKARRK